MSQATFSSVISRAIVRRIRPRDPYELGIDGCCTWNVVANGTFDFSIPSSDPAPVPEPTTLALMGSGIAGLLLLKRRASREHGR